MGLEDINSACGFHVIRWERKKHKALEMFGVEFWLVCL